MLTKFFFEKIALLLGARALATAEKGIFATFYFKIGLFLGAETWQECLCH